MKTAVRARSFAVIFFTGVAVISSPEYSAAQVTGDQNRSDPAEKRGFRMEVRAGIALPAADMRDYVDEGPVVGAGVVYRLAERLSMRADWTAALMRPADRTPLRIKGVDIPVRGSETDLHHLTGGVQVELSQPETGDVEVRAHAGGGVTLLSTEETELAEGGDFTQLTLDLGLELAVPLSDDVRFISRGDLYVLPLQAGAPAHLLREVTLPFTAGVAVNL